MPVLLALLLLIAAFPAAAADVAPADVLLELEAEQYGAASGLSAMMLPGASGGTALALNEGAMLVGALKLPPGQYTLLLRTYAPAGDQDGFFTEVGGARTRRTAPIGQWGVLAIPFKVPDEAKAEALTAISLIGQEPGVGIDQLAVVRGTFKDNEVDLGKLAATAAAGQRQVLQDMPRLQMPARLRELPQGPFTTGPQTLLHESFDAAVAGAGGETAPAPGKWGQALNLAMPDGRYDVAGEKLQWGPTGTIEWWVRPRPAQRLWDDQGWHYFLHCAPTEPAGLSLDLSRHSMTGLRLSATLGETVERVQLSTGRADPEQWHHLLVSWDFREDRQYLWLLLDGVGLRSFFPRSFPAPRFSSTRFANTPEGSGLPWLAMDGALDEVLISSSSVYERLEAPK